MNKATFLILALAFSLIFSSCEKLGNSITPSGTITTETRNITGFDGIKVSDAFQVYVTFSETEESIEIEVNENLHQYIEVFEKDGDLNIKVQDRIRIRGLNTKLNVYITTSDLSYYQISDASKVDLQNRTTIDQLILELSDASTFSGDIYASKLYCDISDASQAYLSGNAKYMNLEVSYASLFKDYSFNANVLEANISDASNAFISVNEELTVNVSDASDFRYKGNCAIISSHVSDSSSIRKTD